MKHRGVGVLIVEGHPGLRDLLRGYVQAIVPEARILEASSAAEARRLAATHSPDVIMLDVVQRDGSSLALAGRLRLDRPASRLVIVTAYDFDEYRRLAASMGVVAYVGKDRVFDELPGALRQAIAFAGAEAGVFVLVPEVLVESAERLGAGLRSAGQWIDRRGKARGRSIWLWRVVHGCMAVSCLAIGIQISQPELAWTASAVAVELGAILVGVTLDLRRLARVPVAMLGASS